VGASAGADKDVAVQALTETNATSNYAAVLSGLNASVSSAALPGGSLKFVAASSRAISLDESFPRPLIVGYLGFDLPIVGEVDQPVRLGVPVRTWYRMSPALTPNGGTPSTVAWSADSDTEIIRQWLNSGPAATNTERREILLTYLKDENYPFAVTTYFQSGARYAHLRRRFVKSYIRGQ